MSYYNQHEENMNFFRNIPEEIPEETKETGLKEILLLTSSLHKQGTDRKGIKRSKNHLSFNPHAVGVLNLK